MIAAFLCLVTLLAPDDLAALDKKLRSGDDRERRAAVIDVAKIGSKEAWMRVIDALSDPSPQVADEAEIQLAKLPAELVPDLCGKKGLQSKDAWVQAHAAGALGSLSGVRVPAASLVPGLDSKSADVRRILCASIEKLAPALQIDDPSKLRAALGDLVKRDDPEVRAAALMALDRMPMHGDLVPYAPAERDPPAVACAILQLFADEGPVGRQIVAGASASAQRAVRAQVVELLAASPDADALKLLVEMLEREKNTRLVWTIDAHLERLSGLSGGGKVGFWSDWVENLGADWKPATRDAKPRAPERDTAVAELAGMPIVSDRIAILIDLSGSTWEKRADGRTRKEQLDEELGKALGSLSEETLFNVVPYTDVPIPWEKGLKPATPANVKRALAFFTDCKKSGKGNFWDAAMLALEWPEVDTILVLTDGAPTGGHRWNIDLMHQRYVERNRFRHVALDAVIVDAAKGMQERWRKFCEATGGRMLAIDMK